MGKQGLLLSYFLGFALRMIDIFAATHRSHSWNKWSVLLTHGYHYITVLSEGRLLLYWTKVMMRLTTVLHGSTSQHMSRRGGRGV